MANLADAYYLLGKYTEAEALFRETLDAMRRVLGPDHPRTLLVLADVAQMYQRQGRYARAEAYASQALDGRKRVFGANHASTIASEADLALADASQGKFAESEALARDALQFFRAKQPDDWQTFFAQSVLGASVAGLGRYAEAEPLLLDGYRGMVDRKDRIIVPYLYYLDRAGEWVVQLYEKWGDRDQAAQWRTRVSAARTDRQHR
jgi:tetratricopeptide (TPR) repeat protein